MVRNVLILNPVSGTAEHVTAVRDIATSEGYDVRETEAEGDGVTHAREAVADDATLVAAAGGDGTLNEVVRGVLDTGRLDQVTVGVVPCGTGNDFAENIGVKGIGQAFDVLEDGERREIDLGLANGRPFLNSCVGGLTAEASAGTDPEMKSRFGTVAYVLETFRNVRSFDGIRVTVDMYAAGEESAPTWSGSAFAVLVGNGRRFPPDGATQANMEDGKFNVTLVNDTSSLELAAGAAAEVLFERDALDLVRDRVPAMTITVEEGSQVAFSLDGEIITDQKLSLRVRPGALRIAVGESYDPSPPE